MNIGRGIFLFLKINPQYDKMEIYGVNVFEPQVTPQETFMVYFRPMSLSKTLQFMSQQKIDTKVFQQAEHTEKLLGSVDRLINMSPENISTEELTIKINGVNSEIVGINKVTEYARGILMYGYIVQILKPKNYSNFELDYDLISIILHTKETDEIGKGEVFIKRKIKA